MKNIMFVCHGNICRSPMAEALFRDMLKKNNLQSKVFVDSSATSYEEIGNPVHNGTRKKLEEFNISVDGLFSTKLKKSDFDKFDYIFVMDNNNLNNIKREFGDYDSE
ncbi:low molecular weight protein-tyrosine-phosphatase, partial [Peptostreptococcus porci]